MPLDLLADRFHRSMGAQEPVRQGFVFAQKSEKQMFCLDIGRPKLAGFVACKKDNAPGFLRIAFKHNALPPVVPWSGRNFPPDLPIPVSDRTLLLLLTSFYRHYAIKGPQNQSTETIPQTFDHVTEGTVAHLLSPAICTKFLHFVVLILLSNPASNLAHRIRTLCHRHSFKPARTPEKFLPCVLAATSIPDGSAGQKTNCV